MGSTPIGLFPAKDTGAPRRLGEVTDKIVAEAGEKALRRWLDEAAQAKTPEEHRAALETAEKIAAKIGVPLADLVFGRAA